MENLLQRVQQHLGKQPQGNQQAMSFRDMVNLVKSAGNPSKAMSILANTGVTVSMPNGQRMNITEFAQAMQGKNPEQAARELGIDYSNVLPFLR